MFLLLGFHRAVLQLALALNPNNSILCERGLKILPKTGKP